jgi:hypothetical protein
MSPLDGSEIHMGKLRAQPGMILPVRARTVLLLLLLLLLFLLLLFTLRLPWGARVFQPALAV